MCLGRALSTETGHPRVRAGGGRTPGRVDSLARSTRPRTDRIRAKVLIIGASGGVERWTRARTRALVGTPLRRLWWRRRAWTPSSRRTDTDFRKGPISARNPTRADLNPPPTARNRCGKPGGDGPTFRGYGQNNQEDQPFLRPRDAHVWPHPEEPGGRLFTSGDLFLNR